MVAQRLTTTYFCDHVHTLLYPGYSETSRPQTGPDIRTKSEAGNRPEVKQEVNRK